MALKILLADDNITAQKLGSKILTEAGNTVIAVSNGAAAVKKIAAEKPELIILDVYMPGYTGLEVCEKVKNAPETARVPVLLTVTNMEPFNHEDGNRVKADGVMIKPFEATDLLAVVKKFEEKIHPPEAVKTMKLEAVKDFEDESYAEWKAEAPEEEAPKELEMPHEVASAPVLGFEDLAPATEPMAEPGTEPAPTFELKHAAPTAHEEVVVAPPAELEFTSARHAEHVEVAHAPELEVTHQEAAAEVPIVRDAALVTDPTEMVQFATKFGEAHPEEIPVGIVMPEPAHEEAIAAIPDLLEQAPPQVEVPPTAEQPLPRAALETAGAAAAAAAPAVEAVPEPEAGVKTQRLEAAPEPEPARITQPVPAVTAPEAPAAEILEPIEPSPVHEEAHEAYKKKVEQQLVAQFAAELEAAQKEAQPEPEPLEEMEPPAEAATAVSASPADQRVADAVTRVLDRYKGELIAAIVRELKG